MKRHSNLSDSLRLRRSRSLRRATRRALGLSVTGARLIQRGRRVTRGRRGSTLLVVIALLGMLSLLGLLFFTFATQEQANATFFADSAKRVETPGDDIEVIFDEAIRQLILGSNLDQKQSALWGGRASLVFIMLGHDLNPFNGSGVRVHRRTSGQLVVDQDRDGNADPDQSLLELNHSPAARNPLTEPYYERRVQSFPAPDVDYTYPDHNNPFLAYLGTTWKTPSGVAPTGYPVIKPSFHRPEFLRDNSGNPINDWATHTSGGGAPFSTAGRLFRPHPDHLYVPRAGQNIPTPVRRFLDDYNPADVGDITSLGPAFAPSAPRGFPFKLVPSIPAPVPGSAPDRKQGVWSLTGLPPNPPFTFPAHDFDVDNNNDGTPDSIWMDLDFPVLIRPSDGVTYIPLISYMVQDLDSLLNLNAVGNLSGNTRTNATSNFGNGFDIHLSSMGLSPSEINPEWALDALPSEATSLSDHGSYFHAPTTTRHLANMEWWWFNKGRVEYSPSRQIHAGRFGEADRVLTVLGVGGQAIGVQMSPITSNYFPFPGVWSNDDNRDSNEGGSITLAGVAGGQTLPFRHPLALNGMGRFWTGPKQLNWHQPVGTDPSRWLRYDGMGVGYDENVAGTGNVDWLNHFGGALMTNTIVGANFAAPVASPNILVDDVNEMILDEKNIRRPDDEPLDYKDTLLLFLSPSDRKRAGVTSRVEDLMPGNITPNTSNFYQTEVAKRFTTASWDVKSFAMPRFIGGVGPDGEPGVAGTDDNGDGNADKIGMNPDQNEIGWPGSDDDRAWEYNVDFDNNGKLEFPPQFLGGSGTEQAYQPNDPFRPQLRRLLSVEFGNTSNPRDAMRLSINELLDVEHRPNAESNPYTDPLSYRPLTPHSTDSTLTTLPAVSPLPTYPPTNQGQQEFWARRDRQQMARDIYVLLYTFCGGNDSVNLATTPGNTAYPIRFGVDVRRQMAQFAVNMVDSLDTDDVMTAFEYDDNLADGWNLDDDFTTNDSGITPRTNVVYGVEAQELTISETLWLYQEQLTGMGDPQPRTPFNETSGRHNVVQIELRSTAPTTVNLALTASTTANTGIWRIHRDDNNNGVVEATENALTFLNGVPAINPAVSTLFTVASSDSTAYGTSCLYIDTAGAMTDFEIVAPNKGVPPLPNATTAPVSSAADLDVGFTGHAGWFALTNGSGGDFLSRNNNPGPPAGTPNSTNFRLERRLNSKLPLLSQAANPFIPVDEYRGVQGRDLAFDPASVTPPAVVSQADAINRLSMNAAFATPDIQSKERRQPLDGRNVADCSASGGPSLHKNTIGQNNSPPSPVAFNLFQPHFDRDFASVVELFDIPLVGPEALTQMIADSRRPPNLINSGGTGVGQLEVRRRPLTFGAAVLLQSEDVNSDGAFGEDLNGDGLLSAGEDTNSNSVLDDLGEDFNNNGKLDAHPYHFHRLLSLVEVPTRTHRQLGDPLKVNRVAGKINLNGVRDPRVLAGLIDDRQVFGAPERATVDLDSDGIIEPGLQDLLGDTVQDSTGTAVQRDWWFQFLIARDGLDPTTALPLPISGFSRPFRDVGYLRYDQEFNQQSSIEETILRELPGAIKYSGGGGKGKGKGKGKAKGRTGGGNGAEGPADGRRLFELATDTEFENGTRDPMMKHRLLSKIIGNTTTRSNVFVVHATIGMFACKELANGAVRIGGQMDVNKDGAPDSYREIFIIDRSDVYEAYDKVSGTFDWKKLLKARQRIN